MVDGSLLLLEPPIPVTPPTLVSVLLLFSTMIPLLPHVPVSVLELVMLPLITFVVPQFWEVVVVVQLLVLPIVLLVLELVPINV